MLGVSTLGNSTRNDGNADQFVDSTGYAGMGASYNVALALRNTFSLAAGASTTYVTTTIFGGDSISPSSWLTPGVVLAQTANSTTVSEAGATDTYTLTLTTPPTSNVTISMFTGVLLTMAPTTLTFTPLNWNAPQTVTVSAVDDAIYQGTHTGIISHSVASLDPGYGGLGIVSLTATITDNDPPPNGVTISESGGSTDVSEAGATDNYTLVLNTMPTANVILSLTNPDGFLNMNPTTLTFTTGNWNTPQTVNVGAIDDTVVQNGLAPFNYTGSITHAATSTDPLYNGVSVNGVNATITDNDLPPGVGITPNGGSVDVTEGGATDTLTVRLNAQPTANVVVTLTPDAFLTVAPAVMTFTTLNWNLAQTATVTAVNDTSIQNAVAPNLYSGIITPTVSSTDFNYNSIAITPVTASITDNDIPGLAIAPTALSLVEGSSQPYTVRLNTLPSASVVVTLTAGTQVTVGSTLLTFTTANWNVPQTVNVTATDDGLAQGPRTVTIAHTTTSGDTNYNAIAVPSVTVDITDNDSVGLVLVESGGATSLGEGGPPTGALTDTCTVVLTSQPTSNVAITLTGDANATVVPSVLTFTPLNWSTIRTFTITAVDDNKIEGLHTGVVTATVASADPNYATLTLPAVTASIADNEFLTIPVTPTSSNLALLEGTAGSYSMALVAAPTADVIITFTPGPGATTDQAALTFTAANWFIPQRVTVTAVDDSIAQGLHTETIAHGVSSADPKYSGLTMANVMVAIVDNDASFVTGTAGNDKILVAPSPRDPGQILVTINGKTTSVPTSVGQLRIQAGAGADTIQVTAPPIPIVIDGEAGTDKLFVNGQTLAGNAFTQGLTATAVNGVEVSFWGVESLTVAGKSQNDVLTVVGLPAIAAEFKGDLGTDQVIGPALGGNFAITGTGAGSLNTTFKFSTVESLTGGAGSDTFTLSPGKKMAGLIDGGSGNDTLDYGAYSGPVSANLQTGAATDVGGFANFENLKGGKGSDKLIGLNQNALWTVATTNAGTYAAPSLPSLVFSGIENLTGGTSDDVFRFADGALVKGKIDTGAGTDTVDYSGYATAVTVNLQAKTGTGGTLGLVGLETILGGTSGADTLVAFSKANVWNLLDQGAGSINGQVLFTQFENLTGGSLVDTFTLTALGSWTGTLDGGSGADELIAFPGTNNVWNSTTTGGTLNGMKFVRVEKHH